LTDWHLVNLFVPTLLPLVFLSALFLFDLSKQDKLKANPLVAIKDGQMSWAGLGMCVSALYELRHPDPIVTVPEPWAVTVFWALIANLLILTLLAALAPVFTTPAKRPSGFWANLKHFRVLVASLLLTIVAGWLYADVHLTTQG
jgi:hypothetical protein